MKLHIQVTESDIMAAGFDGSSCPVAQAIHRYIPNAFVERTRIVITGKNAYSGYLPNVVASLPDVAKEAIRTYDRGNLSERLSKVMEPFEFDLDIFAGREVYVQLPTS